MIKINEAVIVEGKYDKIKLLSILDTVIITTNGFGIFKDKEKLELIKYYARTKGIVVLTDSDSAGLKIRNYIKGAVKEGKIVNVFIPDIFGKEKRKYKPSAEGKLGVEGISVKILEEALKKSGITSDKCIKEHDITNYTMYELGLSGGTNSRFLRERLQNSLGLPSLMSLTSLIEVLNTMMNAAELEKKVSEIKEANL